MGRGALPPAAARPPVASPEPRAGFGFGFFLLFLKPRLWPGPAGICCFPGFPHAGPPPSPQPRRGGSKALALADPAEGAGSAPRLSGLSRRRGVPVAPATERVRARASRGNPALGFETKPVAGGGNTPGEAAARTYALVGLLALTLRLLLR